MNKWWPKIEHENNHTLDKWIIAQELQAVLSIFLQTIKQAVSITIVDCISVSVSLLTTECMGAGVCHLMCICGLTEASQAGAGAGHYPGGCSSGD